MMIVRIFGHFGYEFIMVSGFIVLSNFIISAMRAIIEPYIERKRQQHRFTLAIDFPPVERTTEPSDWIPLHERKKQKALERKLAKERMEKMRVPIHRVINS